MLTRVSLVLTLLLGLLPHVSTTKQPPIPSFWAEWLAAVLACCWLISLREGFAAVDTAASHSRPSTLRVPVAALAFAALAAVLLFQLVARLPMFRGAPLLVLPTLLLAALVCLAGAKLQAAGETARLLDVWSTALVIALVANFVIVLLERQGLHLYIYRFGLRPFPGRAEGLLGQPNDLAVFVVMASVAADYLWMRGKLPTWGHLSLGLMSAFIVAATGSRAGLLLWMAGAALSALALRQHPRRKTGWRLLATAAALTVAAQVLLPWLDATGTALAAARGEGRGRIELWRDSWELIKLHPLMGVGYGNFMAARWTELSGSLFEPNANQAHNLIAQLAVELGIVGAALVLIPLALALWRCVTVVSRRSVSPEQFLAATVALLVAGYSMVQFPLWYTFFLLPFALALGLIEQPLLTISVSKAPRAARWLGWTLAGALFALLVMDYERSEELFTSVDLQQRQAGANALVTIPLQEAANASNLSAFDVYTNLMYARTLHADGLFMGYKLDIADRAMLSMTNEETVGRKISFLVASHEDHAAHELLARTRRSPGMEQLTRGVLKSLAPTNPALVPFLSGLPPLPPAALVNNPPASLP